MKIKWKVMFLDRKAYRGFVSYNKYGNEEVVKSSSVEAHELAHNSLPLFVCFPSFVCLSPNVQT